jgi:3'-phosphoadenosine 5'-phosphosulfate sulfotransferase (PAPS reductase)/FAD synthetase
VFYSGGLMSWAAGKRAVEKYGAENTTLLFTDTLIEDADLYRFLEEGAADIGAPLVRVAEGRTPWEVFRAEKLIGNTRADPCSKILKRQPGLAWLKENTDPLNTVLVFGIHWEEQERLVTVDREGRARGVRPRYVALGWPNVEAPMCDSPWLTVGDIKAWAESCGLRIPRLYGMGFSHNNCGGFCIKAGEGHFHRLLSTLPEVYAHHEAQEDAFNASRPGKRRQTVLAPERMIDGKRRRVPMSLREFREAVPVDHQINLFDVGGCGCFLDEPEAA